MVLTSSSLTEHLLWGRVRSSNDRFQESLFLRSDSISVMRQLQTTRMLTKKRRPTVSPCRSSFSGARVGQNGLWVSKPCQRHCVISQWFRWSRALAGASSRGGFGSRTSDSAADEPTPMTCPRMWHVNSDHLPSATSARVGQKIARRHAQQLEIVKRFES